MSQLTIFLPPLGQGQPASHGALGQLQGTYVPSAGVRWSEPLHPPQPRLSEPDHWHGEHSRGSRRLPTAVHHHLNLRPSAPANSAKSKSRTITLVATVPPASLQMRAVTLSTPASPRPQPEHKQQEENSEQLRFHPCDAISGSRGHCQARSWATL